MYSIGRVRGLAVFLVLGGGIAAAQSTLPANEPTALPAASSQASTVPDAARRAQVVWSGGKLEITADNSSLNQILHEISRETGMKITGGVTDERVFGRYGPGAPAEILERLLDGTGSNMLLRETAAKVPAELILTTREGGPTPPNPNARGFDDDERENEVQAPPQLPPPPPPAAAQADASAAAPTNNGAGATNPTAPGATQTPQEIFEQLQRLQQAQQQPASAH
jgi:hypothetical protein